MMSYLTEKLLRKRPASYDLDAIIERVRYLAWHIDNVMDSERGRAARQRELDLMRQWRDRLIDKDLDTAYRENEQRRRDARTEPVWDAAHEEDRRRLEYDRTWIQAIHENYERNRRDKAYDFAWKLAHNEYRYRIEKEIDDAWDPAHADHKKWRRRRQLRDAQRRRRARIKDRR